MKLRTKSLCTAVCAFLSIGTIYAEDGAQPKPATSTRVYGEWLIQVKPDKGEAYNQLIEVKGLPLFRQAGGRMVGWWNTLVGDLYEHVTIWEYESMAAFEKAVQSLGANERFQEFVKLRDPLLSGEESRLLRLAAGAEQPKLPETAGVIIHEFHHVPVARGGDYLKFMKEEGLDTLKKHGFRPVGPFVVEVGKWSEVTYLFRFKSVDERERLRFAFQAHPDSKTYGKKLSQFVDDLTTRLLLPAPFAQPAKQASWKPMTSPLLPHLTEVVPGVHAAGFADKYRSANCGWISMSNRSVLVDLPRGVELKAFLNEVERISGTSPDTLVLTHVQDGDAKIVKSLNEFGVKQVVTSSSIRKSLMATKMIKSGLVRGISTTTVIGDDRVSIKLIPLDGIVGPGGAAVHLPEQGVLFAGPFVVNGPWTKLADSHTERWVATLEQLESLAAGHVVPGFGSWGSEEILDRQRRFLVELRRQVGFVISQARPREHLKRQVRIPAEYLVWAPYDAPRLEDLDYVYREMTVPAAPFNGQVPVRSQERLHALVLHADHPHEPGYILTGLRRVFEATHVMAHFTVDVRALSAENLSKVDLLVILRDGIQRPDTGKDSNYIWMTPAQQLAIVEYVRSGGAFLNLHNSMGLYPDKGGYLDLVGGRYIGHGPLERFRVEVVDRDHPITRGVEDFSVADEQHTPPYDKDKVHLLLRNRSDEGKVAAAGWVYEPGRGRLCHLANGHTRESLLHPMYQRLLRNAVNWCLRRDKKDSDQ